MQTNKYETNKQRLIFFKFMVAFALSFANENGLSVQIHRSKEYQNERASKMSSIAVYPRPTSNNKRIVVSKISKPNNCVLMPNI